MNNILKDFPTNRAQLNAEDLNSEMAENDGLVLLDVRMADEVAANGHIEGAVNVPLEQLIEMKSEWPAQDASIVIYDSDGYRGNLAMITLRAYGYEDVRNLKGGLAAWQEAELPVATN